MSISRGLNLLIRFSETVGRVLARENSSARLIIFRDFAWLLAWLRAEVHAHGRRHSALELVRNITGEELSPRHLVAYLRERYGALYL